jgi:hypothetical protein
MRISGRIYLTLDWLLNRIASLKASMDCWNYGKTVHGGPAPVDWRVRENLPLWGQWPGNRSKHPRKDPNFNSLVLVGAVEQPSVWVDTDANKKNKRASGRTLGAYIPTPEIDAAWGDDAWLRADEDEDLKQWDKNDR